MTPERWQKIEQLYHAALTRDQNQRAAFLHEACLGDDALRQEIESLLVHGAETKSFLEAPALAAAKLFAEHPGQSFIGRQIGSYQIVSLLGTGGMGEVYQAQDTKLRRDVAIKVLPSAFLNDPERLSRFQREARMLASLNHPNIATIHGLEQADGVNYLVMELVPGETLAERLKTGPMKVEEALNVASQIAEALETVHKKGVIHRDLKPANVKVTPEGRVKVLDFGLAKASAVESAVDLSQAPTLTGLASEEGRILGTPAYMSPEQARGKAVDKRTDIWAFGCVLYELLTGRQAFRAETLSDTIVAILEREPDWQELPVETPTRIRDLLGRCLMKDSSRRLRDLGEACVVIEAFDDPVPPRSVAVEENRDERGQLGMLWKVIVPAAVVFVGLAVGGYFYFHRTPKLTDKDTIVLADFDNKTGDPVFDDTLREGLSIELQQSPFLSLIPDQQVQRTLALMGQPKEARLTREIAQQVCERTGSAAVLEGSIASLGSQYILGLRARNCRTGSVLDQEQVQAARREDVPNSLSRIARRFRTRIGESLATVEKHSKPLEEATTSSLEALKAYTTAMQLDSVAGIPLFRRAIEIDPKFAMAYANLGLDYSDIGESVLSAENTRKAWELRDRVSDQEKFFIDFTNQREVTGNLEDAYQTLELWRRTYPRDIYALGLLAGLSSQGTGRFERVIETAKETIAEDPNVFFGYHNLASSYFFLDRFPEAESVLQQASERKVEEPYFLVLRYNIAALEGDQDQMDRVVALAKGEHGAEHWLAHEQALALARFGRLQDARRSSSRAVDLALQEGEREKAASYRAARAVWEAAYGNSAEARKNATAALKLSKGRDVQYAAGLALALSGESSRSDALADDLEKRFPEDTISKFDYVPVLRALSVLEAGNPTKSSELLQIALQYELAANGLNFNHFYLGGLHSAYVRGKAFAAAHRYPEAAAEFQKILDHRGLVGLDPIGAFAHLQLGRTFVLSGDKTKARTAYQDLLTLWKDADPDIPILKQAKAEYAKLK
jgi:eukaryotic-like serine/threonine-protein kinase